MRKLIEHALPLAVLDREASREKSIRHGHPSTLHLWWSRKPLAAARCVLFAQLVDDPGDRPDLYPTAEEQHAARARLLDLCARLAPWEVTAGSPALDEAREVLREQYGSALPTAYDPFSGGGSIPLEAQRLGLPVVGADLNPVAALLDPRPGRGPGGMSRRTPWPPTSAGTAGRCWSEPLRPPRSGTPRYVSTASSGPRSRTCGSAPAPAPGAGRPCRC